MNKNKKDKPFTKEDFGLALHKYIIPIYEEVKNNSREIKGLKGEINEVKKSVERLYERVDTVERIQLRMENNLVDDNKLLHDRDDIQVSLNDFLVSQKSFSDCINLGVNIINE